MDIEVTESSVLSFFFLLSRSDNYVEIIPWRFLIKVFHREMSDVLLSSGYCMFGTKF